MFESSLLQSSAPRKAISLGYLVELILLGLVALIPLIHLEALPGALVSPTYLAPPSPPAAAPRRQVVRSVTRPVTRKWMTAPLTIPNRIVHFNEAPAEAIKPPAGAVPDLVPWGDGRGLPEGFGGFIPPPPSPAHREPSPARLHVGGAVEAAKLVFQPHPEYPAIARMARVQGTVRLGAIITRDGTIESLEVLSGPPLLIKAAMDAVSRWRYQPTLLNGEPVEVSTEIDVNFVLAE